MENYFLLIGAVMCIIMALGVVFDSAWKSGNDESGLFSFKHRWVSCICKPMLLFVPVLALAYAAIVPMDVANIFVEYACRIMAFFGILVGAAFIFVCTAAVFLFCKGMSQAEYQ